MEKSYRRNHNKRIDFRPVYDTRTDYTTSAKSYYDYLANLNEWGHWVELLLNRLLDRNIEVSDTNTVDLTKIGDWINNETDKNLPYPNFDDIVNLTADVILSNEEKEYYFENIPPYNFNIGNATEETETGLYTPNFKEVIDALAKNIDEISQGKYLVYPMFEFGIENDSSENINEKFQNAIDYVSEKNGILYFQEGTYYLSGDIDLKSNLTILLAPKATIYCEGVIFRGKSTSKGYEGGIQNFTLRGGTITSSFEKLENGDITASKFLIHHGKNLAFQNVNFVEFVQGHAIDFCGVKDVLIDNCKFVGKHLLTDLSNDYLEAIQLDHSSNTSLGNEDETQYVDYLPSIDFTIRNSQSLPIYDTDNELVYYAPVLAGNHSQFPLSPKNVWITNNYMLDGVPVSATNWSEKMSGWIHFSTIQNLHVINNRFINTQHVRANGVTIRDRTMHLEVSEEESDYEQTSNIFIEGNYLQGFNSGGQTGMVGMISVRGWYDYKKIDNIFIKGNRFVDCGLGEVWDNETMRPNDIIRLSQVSKVTIEGNHVDTCDRFLLVDAADNGENSSVANILVSDNHVDTVTYNTASISLVNSGTLKMSNNIFSNIAGSVRVTGDGTCINHITGNTFTASETYDLSEIEGVSENFKGKFISISNSENETHIISDNIFQSPINKIWQTAIEQSTIIGSVIMKNNVYNTVYEFYMQGQGTRLTLDKYISFIGDSHLTYENEMTESTAPTHYPKGDVDKVTFTSWYRTIQELGSRMHLLQNNSWSGSQVTNTGESTGLASMLNRCENLASDNQNPDIVFIQGGKNDFNRNILIGDFNPYNENRSANLMPETFSEADGYFNYTGVWVDNADYDSYTIINEDYVSLNLENIPGRHVTFWNVEGEYIYGRSGNASYQIMIPEGTTTIKYGFRKDEIDIVDVYEPNVTPSDETTFSSAYYILLDRIARKYPLARIVCATIPFDNYGEMPRKRPDGVTLRDFNDVIRDTASVFSAEIVELDKVNFNRYNINSVTDDGNHPNSEGMKRYSEEYLKILRNYI